VGLGLGGGEVDLTPEGKENYFIEKNRIFRTPIRGNGKGRRYNSYEGKKKNRSVRWKKGKEKLL